MTSSNASLYARVSRRALNVPWIFSYTLNPYTDWRQAAQHDSLLRPLCRARGYIGRTQDLSDLWKPARPLLNDQSRLSDGHRQPHFRLLDRPYGNEVSSWEDILKRAHILTKARFPPPLENVDLAPGPAALQGTIKCYSNRDEEAQSDIWKVQIE